MISDSDLKGLGAQHMDKDEEEILKIHRKRIVKVNDLEDKQVLW